MNSVIALLWIGRKVWCEKETRKVCVVGPLNYCSMKGRNNAVWYAVPPHFTGPQEGRRVGIGGEPVLEYTHGKRLQGEEETRSGRDILSGRMDLRDLYQSGPPCMSRAVDGFVRIGTVCDSWFRNFDVDVSIVVVFWEKNCFEKTASEWWPL